jgi:hypothetical protein
MKTNDIVNRAIENAMSMMFPHGAGHASDRRVRHALEQVAQRAFIAGRHDALMGLMTVQDVADHFGISPRRARALIKNRHERFGAGMKVGNSWLVHRDKLPALEPDEKYR